MEEKLQPAEPNERRIILVLHGLGGIGKTQLSLRFSSIYKDHYTAVFWLNGQSRDSLRRSILGIAKRLPRFHFSSPVEGKTLQEGEMDIAVQQVLGWFGIGSNKKWLLLYDNVDRDASSSVNDPQAFDVTQYIPQVQQGSIIITTRRAELSNLGEDLNVTTMGAEESSQVLRTRMNDKSLGKSYLPLFLAFCGHVLRRPRF